MEWDRDKEPLSNALEKRKSFLQLAMSDGLSIGLLFIVQTLSLLLYKTGAIASLLLVASLLGIPILLFIKGIQFRERQMNGAVRYMHVVGYLSWAYMFAVAIGFIAYFLVTNILFRDAEFIAMMEQSFELTSEMTNKYWPQYKEAIASIRNITPMKISGAIAIQSLFHGLIYIYIIGLFIKRGGNK